MESGDGTEPGGGWFFDRTFEPGDSEGLAAAVADWLGSAELRWLIENVPGRRQPLAAPERLRWPAASTPDPHPHPAASSRARLNAALELLGEICDWSRPGTVWDFRPAGGERTLGAGEPATGAEEAGPPAKPAVEAPAEAEPPEEAIAERAVALGLRSTGQASAAARTFVVLGGRRAAPLNRARAAAEAIAAASASPARVVLLCTDRPLDPAERSSPEVASYAASAATEVDLMRAAAARTFAAGPDDGSSPNPSGAEVGLVEVPSDERGRASTYDTLLTLAARLPADAGAVALVTSPTCRPFQYLDAVRALGLGAGLRCEVIAHPPAWAAEPGAAFARPHVYLQEIRSVIQAAGRLARDLRPAPDSTEGKASLPPGSAEADPPRESARLGPRHDPCGPRQ